MINIDFKSILELVKAFPDEQTCINHLEALRWNGNVVSPFDATSKVYKCAGNKYKCKNTGKYFNVRTATLFDNTKIELQTWFIAIYLLTGHKKGISSLQLSRDLNVTQKTAWFMAQRIRNCFGLTDDGDKIGNGGGEVEVDECFIGGKEKNKHKSKKTHTATEKKAAALGMVERNGKLIVKHIKRATINNIHPEIKRNIAKGAQVMTDESPIYKSIYKLKRNYRHESVNHSAGMYVYGNIHTNTIEGFWSLLQRGIIGIYHFTSHKHLQKYLNEFAFRYNTRTTSDCSRFNMLLSNTENRLTYKSLIQK